MTNTDTTTISDSKKGKVVLKKTKVPASILVSNVILSNLANKRQVSAHTKTKGEVSGGGKKPWKQKGTGQARSGSNRSPIWVGGGITFGPRKVRNFSRRVNRKQGLLVLNHLLNTKSEDGKLVIVEKIVLEQVKTKELIRFLSTLGVDNTALMVLDNEFSASTEAEKVYLSGKNIGFLNIIPAKKLSSYLVSKYKWVIITEKALQDLNNKLSFSKEEERGASPVKKTVQKAKKETKITKKKETD